MQNKSEKNMVIKSDYKILLFGTINEELTLPV